MVEARQPMPILSPTFSDAVLGERAVIVHVDRAVLGRERDRAIGQRRDGADVVPAELGRRDRDEHAVGARDLRVLTDLEVVGLRRVGTERARQVTVTVVQADRGVGERSDGDHRT